MAKILKTINHVLAGFAGKYSNEITHIGTALNVLLNALPLERQEKTIVKDVIHALDESAANVRKAISEIAHAPIDEKVIAALVVKHATPLIEKAVKDAFAKNKAAGSANVANKK